MGEGEGTRTHTQSFLTKHQTEKPERSGEKKTNGVSTLIGYSHVQILMCCVLSHFSDSLGITMGMDLFICHLNNL